MNNVSLPLASPGVRDELRIVRPRRAGPAEAARVTRAEINLAHVRHNLRELKAFLAATADAKAPQIWGVLKADGYGHGARNIALALEQAGVDGLCVALLEEGLELRDAGVTKPILVMGGYYGRYRDGIEALIEQRLTPVVYDVAHLHTLANIVRYRKLDAPLGIHLKVDTGMGRLGVRGKRLDEVLTSLRSYRELNLVGLMTHIACADAPTLDSTREQLRLFDEADRKVQRAGFSPSIRHASNSAAMLRCNDAHMNLVRPGIALFGVHPCPKHPTSTGQTPNLKQVMRVLSGIVDIRTIPKGDRIGYGHTWQAQRDSIIATIPMGYGDGLSRSLAERGSVLVCGKRAPIVGAVSMDLTMIDVTDVAGAAINDEVVVLGAQRGRLGEDRISADELAANMDTISWECLTGISRRVPRYYRQP